MHEDDEWPDEIEVDPRWEVQPEPHDDPGSNSRPALVGGLALILFVAVILWLVMGAQPAL